MEDDIAVPVAPAPPDDSPAPAATLGSPAPAAPASDAPALAAPVEEAEPAAEEPAEGVQEPAPFAAFKEAEDLFDHPDVKAVHETGLRKAREEAYTELQSHMQPKQQERNQNVTRALQAVEAIDTTLKRAQEDGALDKRAVEDVFRTHRTELAGFTGEASTSGYYQGVEQYLTFLLGSDAPEFITRLHKMRDASYPDETFAADAKKKMMVQARQEGYDEGFRKGSKQGKDAGAAKTAIQANKGEGANLAPGTPAGGGSNLNKRRQDYHEGKTNEYPG